MAPGLQETDTQEQLKGNIVWLKALMKSLLPRVAPSYPVRLRSPLRGPALSALVARPAAGYVPDGAASPLEVASERGYNFIRVKSKKHRNGGGLPC